MERFDLSQLSNFEQYKEMVQITKEVNLYPLIDKLICGRPFFFDQLKDIIDEYIKPDQTNQGKIFLKRKNEKV